MAYNLTELDNASYGPASVAAVTSITTLPDGTIEVTAGEWNGTFFDNAVDNSATNFTIVDPMCNIVSYTFTSGDGSDTTPPLYGKVVGYDPNTDTFIINQYSTYLGPDSPFNILLNNHYTIVSPSTDLSTTDGGTPSFPFDFTPPTVYPTFVAGLLGGTTLPATGFIDNVGVDQVSISVSGVYTVTGGTLLDPSGAVTWKETFTAGSLNGAVITSGTSLTIDTMTTTSAFKTGLTKISVGDVFTVTVASNAFGGEQPITVSVQATTAQVGGSVTKAAGIHNIAVAIANQINANVGFTVASAGASGGTITLTAPGFTQPDGTTDSSGIIDVSATVSHVGAGTQAGAVLVNSPYSSLGVHQVASGAQAGDVFSATFLSGGLNGLVDPDSGLPLDYTISYTVQAGDVGSSANHAIAVGLINAINGDATLQALGITAGFGPGTGSTAATASTVQLYAPNALDETVVTGGATNGNLLSVNAAPVVVTGKNGTGGFGGNTAWQLVAFDNGHALLANVDAQGNISGYQLVSDTSLDPSVVGGNPANNGQFNTPLTLSEFSDFTPPPCFTVGTRIATPAGEAPVEMLRIGDKIMTVAGQCLPVKWLGRRSYGSRAVADSFAIQPVRIKAGALGEGLPTRDLVVSPQHAMLIDGMLIPAAALVNGRSIIRCGDYGDVTYIHIELENHEAILAEGAPTETFVDCDSRAMFDNAAEFAALYPRHVAAEPKFYAPRIEDGDALEEIRQRIAALSGNHLTLVAKAPGALRGHVERIDRADGLLRVEGWVQDTANPTLPVRLEVLVDGRVVSELLANRYRSDLEAARLAGGRCAFDIELPMIGGAVQVRRACDGAKLAIAAEAEALAMAA